MLFKEHCDYLAKIEAEEKFTILHAVVSPTCVGYHHPECRDKHILFVYLDNRYAPSRYPSVIYKVDDHQCYREVKKSHAYTGYPLHALFSGFIVGSSQAMGIMKSQQVIMSLPDVYKTLELICGIYYDSQLLSDNYLSNARRHYMNIQLGAYPNRPVLFLYLLLNCLAVKQCHYYVKFTLEVNQLVDQSQLPRRIRSLLKDLYVAYQQNTFLDHCQEEAYNEVVNLLYNYAKNEGEDRRESLVNDHSIIEKAYRNIIEQYR